MAKTKKEIKVKEPVRIREKVLDGGTISLYLDMYYKGNRKKEGLSGCEKIDVNKLEGTWSEQYDPSVFAMDGSVTYTFDRNNGYQLHVYDALSGESHDYSGQYAIDLINKGTITINPAMSDFSNVTYKIVKLTSKEMVWQKEGTTYSQGTWGSDYRHFVRGK